MNILSVRRRSLPLILVIVLFPISKMITDYSDEMLAVVSILYLVYSFACGKVERNEKRVILLLLAVALLGLVSNVFSGIKREFFVIAVDVLEYLKAITIFMAARVFYRGKDFRRLAKEIMPIAKAVMIIAFACALLSQVTDIGMTIHSLDGKVHPVHGIKPFGFVFLNAIQTYYLLAGCCLFIAAGEPCAWLRLLYVAMFLLTNVLTGATLVWGGDLLLLVLYVYYTKHSKIRIGIILVLFAALVLVAFTAISEYLFNTRAPRYVLLYYGFYTAVQYFPLGSGFSTYGGEMAARYYSPLYWQYGFNERYGLSHTGYGGILNDDYIAMIAAQFGLFAFALWCFMYYRVFKLLDLKKVSKRVKPVLISVFGVFVCSMTISSSSNTWMGIWMYALLGLCSVGCSTEEYAQKPAKLCITVSRPERTLAEAKE